MESNNRTTCVDSLERRIEMARFFDFLGCREGSRMTRWFYRQREKLGEYNPILLLYCEFVLITLPLRLLLLSNKMKFTFDVLLQVALNILSHYSFASFIFCSESQKFSILCVCTVVWCPTLDALLPFRLWKIDNFYSARIATECRLLFTIGMVTIANSDEYIVDRRAIDVCAAPFRRLDSNPSTCTVFWGVQHRSPFQTAIWIEVSSYRWQMRKINASVNLFNVASKAIADRRRKETQAECVHRSSTEAIF